MGWLVTCVFSIKKYDRANIILLFFFLSFCFISLLLLLFPSCVLCVVCCSLIVFLFLSLSLSLSHLLYFEKKISLPPLFFQVEKASISFSREEANNKKYNMETVMSAQRAAKTRKILLILEKG